MRLSETIRPRCVPSDRYYIRSSTDLYAGLVYTGRSMWEALYLANLARSKDESVVEVIDTRDKSKDLGLSDWYRACRAYPGICLYNSKALNRKILSHTSSDELEDLVSDIHAFVQRWGNEEVQA